ncbi:hypothetical protein LIPSTDRAFT_75650 [Lipomyces starkeyi NRRL Y-11557]|uniref:MULE transposase domain-containing protein n=1 Tax=Lipomyces starkeyi NRRL Y-11557 TaxID=675824 RepID=A0A1E3PVI1_LIPST|nr:hypothetical protein LIPSTDRAFT_75650 [Lipomyces starkeyi NRRL Y-11557]
MQQLKEIVFPDQSPDVVTTDADKALMKALSTVFLTMNQLCWWHVQQNILKNCRKYFKAIGVSYRWANDAQNDSGKISLHKQQN